MQAHQLVVVAAATTSVTSTSTTTQILHAISRARPCAWRMENMRGPTWIRIRNVMGEVVIMFVFVRVVVCETTNEKICLAVISFYIHEVVLVLAMSYDQNKHQIRRITRSRRHFVLTAGMFTVK